MRQFTITGAYIGIHTPYILPPAEKVVPVKFLNKLCFCRKKPVKKTSNAICHCCLYRGVRAKKV